MATIKTQLQLNDGITSVLRKMNSALLTCLDSFESMQKASGKSIDVRNISGARSQLIEVTRELEEINSGQKNVNESMSQGVGIADTMLGKIAKMATAYLSVRSAINFVKGALESAFESQNINTQLAVSLKNTGLGKDAYDQLTDAAKNYGMYTQTAMTAAAAEFATYMSDSDAIESMMGTLTNYMAGMSGGGALDTSQVVDYATQLGKVLNGTYDGIAKKGFEVSDVQKEILENGTDMEKAAVVADIINDSWGNLYECMANTPEGKLITLQNTVNQMKEDMATSLLPVILQLVETVQKNLPTIESLINGVGTAANAIIPILAAIIEGALGVAQFFIDNWSWLEPIVWGIAAALATYYGIMLAINTVEAISNGLKAISAARSAFKTGATLAEAAATKTATGAQVGLNAALLANPLTWIILLIVAVVVAIYKWVQSVGGLTNAWEICKSALLVAWNAIKVAWYAVVYGVTWGINKVMDFVDLLKLCWQKAGVAVADYMSDMKVSVLTILQNMINNAVDIINSFINTLNKIPGVNIGLIEQVTFATTAAAENEAAKKARAEQLASYEADLAASKAERDANLANAKSNLDNATAELAASANELADLYAASRAAANSAEKEADAADSMAEILAGNNGLPAIAENTESTASSLKDTTEDLKYLRDIAEQEAINRFTTAEVKIDMTGMTNHIDSDMDLDGVLAVFTEGFAEALEIAAEGVHA